MLSVHAAVKFTFIVHIEAKTKRRFSKVTGSNLGAHSHFAECSHCVSHCCRDQAAVAHRREVSGRLRGPGERPAGLRLVRRLLVLVPHLSLLDGRS